MARFRLDSQGETLPLKKWTIKIFNNNYDRNGHQDYSCAYNGRFYVFYQRHNNVRAVFFGHRLRG